MERPDNSKISQAQGKTHHPAGELNKGLNFWLCAGLLILLLASIMSREISRPFYGLHSWGRAHDAWMARSHVRYGLGYTKGFETFAVGNPPAEKPLHYLDHPVPFALLNALAMLIFGVNTWALRLTNLIATAVSLLLFLKILRRLTDEMTALLAGLFFVIFPLIGYFGVNFWLFPLCFLAIWCYLVLIGALEDGPKPGKIHKLLLAVSLFLVLQMTWEGFFWALAIGVHYVFHCIRRKRFPEISLLAILVIAPLSSLVLNFVVLAAGRGWDIQGIIEVAKWRAGRGEMEHVMAKFDWVAWFRRVWDYAITNFTFPVLIIAIGYLTLGQLFVFAAPASEMPKGQPTRRFPQFWLFLMPPVFQLFILKGTLWQHQYWERPLIPFVAIAAALGVMVVADIVKKLHARLAVAAIVLLVGLCFVYCMMGTDFYYSMRWRAPEMIKMFETLKSRIPPDKALLSFESFIVDQHEGKQAAYRGETGWHLDREIQQARSIEEIEGLAATGKYPYYLIPYVKDLLPLINSLAQRYKYEAVAGAQGKRTKNGKFLRAGMYPYMIFDLNSKPDAQ